MEKIVAAQKLSKTHHLIHVHANNCVPMQTGGPPWVGEFTWLRKDVPVKGLNTKNLPQFGLDFPNDPTKPDHNLSHWPFVFY